MEVTAGVAVQVIATSAKAISTVRAPATGSTVDYPSSAKHLPASANRPRCR